MGGFSRKLPFESQRSKAFDKRSETVQRVEIKPLKAACLVTKYRPKEIVIKNGEEHNQTPREQRTIFGSAIFFSLSWSMTLTVATAGLLGFVQVTMKV